MRQIFIDNEPTIYYIFPDGRLMNQATGHYYKGSIRGGYRQFDLRWKGKKRSFSQHRLLAEYYLDNPNNLPVVHHKDHNRLNNQLDNLEWVSFSENNLSNNKEPSSQNAAIKECNFENEEWRNFRDSYYSISSYGRVRNNKTGRILKSSIGSTGYFKISLKINKKSTTFLVHRIVYEAFYNEIPKVINHRDGNKLNNHISNLENVTYLENNLKALYETKTRKYKKVAQYDKEGNLIRIYENNAEAARAMGIRAQSIQAAIKNHYCSCGYYWNNLDVNDEASSAISEESRVNSPKCIAYESSEDMVKTE